MSDDTSTAEQAGRIPVVGIGASAGGLAALQSLFEAVPNNLGCAFVVIVHLDPAHTSQLPRILATRTSMRVMQVTTRTALAPDTVYVIPPDRRLLITGNEIATAPFDEPRGHRAPVDLFFRSLAEQHGDGLAVILSGGGSDGAVGVRAIKEQGGLILVQDPSEAEFPSMPRSAIASGADFVLPIRELADQLAELVRAKQRLPTSPPDAVQEELVRRILSHLRTKTGQDFSNYKRATVLRRLARRMQVTQSETLAGYLAHLRDDPEEVHALFNDLLISVTSFFRDPDAFRVLANAVIPRLFSEHGDGEPIRVWVPGCATGEEVYSIAMLLLEESSRSEMRPEIQIFASDLDAAALTTARDGRYPATINADVSEERLRRFFTREGLNYRIRREVRDLVVFAAHSLLKDPPFSHLNLVSCRNLLIYLDRELQHQVIGVFHYALCPRGFLFLGTSETADSPPGLFNVVDRDARIFQVTDRPRDRLPPMPRGLSTALIPELPRAMRSQPLATTTDAAEHRQALEQQAPPSMLVNENHVVINLSESAGRYLLLPGGPLTSDATDLVRPELKLELRTALHKAIEHGRPTLGSPIAVRFNGAAQAVILQVRPLTHEQTRAALVFFLEGDVIEPADVEATPDESASLVNQLREELVASRSLQRATREQYESATEELRAANEELQSINEEYRSTAEELETSKEELQSINEELQTLNNELKLKLEMVSRAHNDLQNLMAATDVGTLFLDTDMRIKRFTPRVCELFNVVSGDEGRPVTDFTHRVEYDGLVGDAKRVLADLAPFERTLHTSDGRWFLMRLRPYRTMEDKIEGVIATFFDVTERRRAETSWNERQRMLLHELSHRVKNTLAVVQALVRQSLRDSGASRASLDILEARLQALAATHDMLLSNEWKGASLEGLARLQLAHYLAVGSQQFEIAGPAVVIPPATATPLGLVLHELCTNATKHGALSVPQGHVSLTWSLTQRDANSSSLEITWSERGGPAPTKPLNQGTGWHLIDNAVSGARVTRNFGAEGLECRIEIPMPASGEPSGNL